MSQSTQPSTVQFYNQTLITFEQNNVQYVAMKPICENIGVAWHSQFERIKRDDILSTTMIITIIVAEDGKNREMVCLPIEYLNGWLFGIDVKRVRPEIRETLIKYKKECYQALHNYWFNGKAERSQNVQQNLPLANPEADEEALEVITRLYHALVGGYELAQQFHKPEHRYLRTQIDTELGGHYIHNLYHPTRNALEQAKKYIHAKSERIMYIKGMLSLLNEPLALR